MTGRVTGRAFARAGLLGNPSDAYGGKAIAVSIFERRASVHLEPAEDFAIANTPAGDALRCADLAEALTIFARDGCSGPSSLLRAALKRFAEHALCDLAPDDPRGRFHMRLESDIPFQVGLAGSSAIVIAALRALAQWFGIELDAFDQAELALAAEVEDLGIAAGPMDRAIQAYEGALVMDFGGPRTRTSYRALDPASLPPLFIAWDPRGGEHSGSVHADVRRRWQDGDPEVHAAMALFAELVDEGLACLEDGDTSGFRRLADRNFETRAGLFAIAERDRALVEIGRAAGAGVKLCGSGGAVVGVLEEAALYAKVAPVYAAAGFESLQPEFSAPPPGTSLAGRAGDRKQRGR
jgi:glucuronokinase